MSCFSIQGSEDGVIDARDENADDGFDEEVTK